MEDKELAEYSGIKKGIQSLVEDVVAKKELRSLDKEFVSEKLACFLRKHKELGEKAKLALETKPYKQFKRSKEYKAIIKGLRAELREIYGVFILKDYDKRHALLENLLQNPSLENHNKILELHKSSKERLPYYDLIYKKIIKITGTLRRIVDLACGLNPLSYPYLLSLNCKPEYVACDLAKKDLEFVQEYFKMLKIKGKTEQLDLINDVKKLAELTKNSDAALLLKTLDGLEAVERGFSEELLAHISSRFIIVSFSTKSIGGKKNIKKEKRSWFERLLEKRNLEFQSFEVPGEIFYIIKNNT